MKLKFLALLKLTQRFGFDAPTKFNAWEVLNPIAIEVELIAKRK